jgi:hypothetical protein
MGGSFMKFKLNKAHIDYCKNLILMPLAQRGNYSGLLRELLARFKDKDAELVTHPGLEMKTNSPDNYSMGRYVEYCSILDHVQVELKKENNEKK